MADAPSPWSRVSLLSVALIVGGLYFGRDILVPLALAALLSFALEPLVRRLTRWHLRRGLSVAIVTVLVLALAAATAGFIGAQLRTLGKDLPTYQANISTKMKTLRRELSTPGVMEQLSRVFGTVERELEAAQREVDRRGEPAADKPTRVEMVQAPPGPVDRLTEWLGSLSGPLTMAGIVLFLTVVMLAERADLRDRALRLLGPDVHRNHDALIDAGRRVRRYLLMQLLVNTLYGIPLAAGLAFLGVPGALLWGFVAALLRFVPYLGPMIAAIFPLALAFAVDPGWSVTLWTLGLVVTLEVLSNNFLEPWLYGANTGMSALSLVVAATFWTVLWGPLGLLLSTPVTVTLLALGKHIPQLAILDILLGNQPALDAPTRLHQRLVSGNVDEAATLALDHADAHSIGAFYAQLGLPVLRLAAADAAPESDERKVATARGMAHVMALLREAFQPAHPTSVQVLCLGLADPIDTLAADMLAHLLKHRRVGAVTLEGRASDVGDAVAAAWPADASMREGGIVILVSTSAGAGHKLLLAQRRIKRRHADAALLVLDLGRAPMPERDSRLPEGEHGVTVCHDVDEVLQAIATLRGGLEVDDATDMARRSTEASTDTIEDRMPQKEDHAGHAHSLR